VLEPDDDEGTSFHEVGLRTLVLTGSPIVTAADVEGADVGKEKDAYGGYYVMVTLGPGGAERFRAATREWIDRRLAIVVNGHVDSAPIVKSEIGGGRMTITMGAGTPEKQLADARSLAASLGGE
jgi:preprotein translocase subunit SecD